MSLIKNKITTRLALLVARDFLFAYAKSFVSVVFFALIFLFMLELPEHIHGGPIVVARTLFFLPFGLLFFSVVLFFVLSIAAFAAVILGVLTSLFLVVVGCNSLFVWLFSSLLPVGVGFMLLKDFEFIKFNFASYGFLEAYFLFIFVVVGLVCGYLMRKSALKFMS